MDFLFQPRGLGGEFFRQLGQSRPVDLDAVALHLRDHGHQRAIDPLVDARSALGGQSRLEHLVKPPGYIRIFRRIFGRLVERDLAEGDRLLARPAEFLERQAGVAEVAFGKFVHAMPAADAVELATGIEIEADDHRVVDGRDDDAVAGEHVEIVFAVVEHLGHGIARQHGGERGQRGSLVHLRGRSANMSLPPCPSGPAGIVGIEREADANEIACMQSSRVSVSTAWPTSCAATQCSSRSIVWTHS